MSEQREKALSVAAAVLNYKNRSSRKLFDKLIEKGISPEDAEHAIERLRDFGYLDDGEYALSVLRPGMAKGWGRERIRRKMQEEKLDEQTIELALHNYTLDEDRLDSFIAAQGCDLSDPRERKKISDKLYRRGYSWEEIGAALRRCRADSYED